MAAVWKNWKLKMSNKIDNLAELLKEILVEQTQDNSTAELSYLKFSGDVEGKGIVWHGNGNAKQFVWHNNPDRFFSSEVLDLARNRHYAINGVKVLSETELGSSITKSSLREVGRLKGLIVDGSLSVDQFLYYDSESSRLGLGTEQPNAALSISDQGVEIVIGAREFNNAGFGAFNSASLELITDNTTRLTISASGDIELGNRNNGPIKAVVHGSLGVNVGSIDPRTQLHIGGAVKFNDTLHLKGERPPESGTFNQGDIVWNSNPQQRNFVGWICTQSGNPGIWCQFGEIR